MKKNSNNKKPTHSLFSNVRFLFGLHWKYSKESFILLLLGVPVSLGLSYCGVYIPKVVVQQIIEGGDYYKVFTPILIIGLIILILNLLNRVISTINFALLSKFRNCLLNLKAEKCLNTDYENIESPKFRFLMQRADEALMGSNSGSVVEQMSKESIALVTSILGYILFGTVLSFANPLIILFLTIMPIINYFVIRSIQKYQYKSKDETTPLDKKLWYIATNAENYKSAKDIRIYGMNSWLIKMFKYFTKERLRWDAKLSKKYFISSVIEGIVILLRDGGAYILLMLIDSLIRQIELMQSRSGGIHEAVYEIDKQIADLGTQNLVLARLHTNGILNAAEYASQSSEISNKITALRVERRKKIAEDADDELLDDLRTLDDILENYEPSEEFDEELFGQTVERITVNDNTRLTFRLLGGLELTETIKERGRCKPV